MMPFPLSVALVGVGGYGQAHLKTLAALEPEGMFRLTDVVDPDPERLPECFRDLEGKGIRWHRNWEELCAEPVFPDCVLLVLPISLHAKYTRLAYERGAWVYLEKPPVPLLSEIDELIEMERFEGQKRTQVGFQFAYSKQMEVLRGWLSEGRLGRVIRYRLSGCRPRTDAYYQRAPWAGRIQCDGRAVLDGPVTNALAHGVQDIFAIEAAATGQVSLPVTVSAELYRSRDIESYDMASWHGEFPSGAKFAIALSHASAKILPTVLEIIGTEGTATLSGEGKALSASFTPEFISGDEPTMQLALRAFFLAVHEGNRPLLGLEEVRPFVAATNAMVVAAGKIHDIPQEYHQEITTSHGVMHDVTGIHEFSRKAVQHGETFSHVGAPWGNPGGTLRLDHLLIEKMGRHLSSYIHVSF